MRQRIRISYASVDMQVLKSELLTGLSIHLSTAMPAVLFSWEAKFFSAISLRLPYSVQLGSISLLGRLNPMQGNTPSPTRVMVSG